MVINFIKSIFHNIGVVFVGFVMAFVGTRIDLLLGASDFKSQPVTVIAWILLIIGFLIRAWATFYFYQYHMSVIRLSPQNTLITSGPYRFSRNPLYLGGNVFIFLGAALFFGSPTALVITALNIPLTDWMIRREEKQLEQTFGQQWLNYKKTVGRWF
jgi:protein-S-isoprenylcysteine O-methyltransferase Ste14